ncbi:hypothetical protein GCM10009786_17740 [Leucobacter alluvii]|uniref:Uncharacterized protein n=1 Tax=Leucobacter alluvii TaxID=340321 RepID=A0ABN3B6C7_9MICO
MGLRYHDHEVPGVRKRGDDADAELDQRAAVQLEERLRLRRAEALPAARTDEYDPQCRERVRNGVVRFGEKS